MGPKPLGADAWLASVLPGVRQPIHAISPLEDWPSMLCSQTNNTKIVSAIPCNKAVTWQHTSSKLLASHYSDKSHNIDGQTLNRPTIHTDRQMASWRQNSWEFGDVDSLLWSRWHAPLGHLSPHRPLQLLCFHIFFRHQSCGGVPIAPSHDAVLISLISKVVTFASSFSFVRHCTSFFVRYWCPSNNWRDIYIYFALPFHVSHRIWLDWTIIEKCPSMLI